MMDYLKLLLALGWRNLWRNRRRTLVILFAIALGVWSMVTMAAFMRGIIHQVVNDAINNLTGHIQIHAPQYRDDPVIEHSMKLPSAALREVLQKNKKIIAWSARVRVPAVIASERESSGVTLVGIDPNREITLSFLFKATKKGRYLKDVEDKGVIIGRKLAERLQTGVGKRIVLMSQDRNNEIADRGFRIVGIFDATLESTELAYVFVGRSVVQKMLGMGQDISEIGIKTRDREVVDAVTAKLRQAAPRLDIQPWNVLQPLLQARVTINNGFTIIWFVVVFVAMGFGLVNTLLMAVFERTREFGLFQALGMRPRFILGQVMCEAFFLLLIGLAIGNLLSLLTLQIYSDGIDVSGLAKGAQMIGLSNVIPLDSQFGDVVVANALVIGLGLLASFYPAWRAARYVPVEAITRT